MRPRPNVNCAVAGLAGPPSPVGISLRLERMELTDVEAGMVAAWCRDRAVLVAVRKLWLFDNRLGDAGAAALAGLMSADMLEVTRIDDTVLPSSPRCPAALHAMVHALSFRACISSHFWALVVAVVPIEQHMMSDHLLTQRCLAGSETVTA